MLNRLKLKYRKDEIMFRCAWCMKKIAAEDPLLGLNITFADNVDFSEKEGEIIQVFLESRNTSVPMIVTTSDSEAKKNGSDGIFALCTDKCAKKMRKTLVYEKKTFKNWA